jgi:hypothetical protein
VFTSSYVGSRDPCLYFRAGEGGGGVPCCMYFTVHLAVWGVLSGGWGMGVGVARVLVRVAQADYG